MTNWLRTTAARLHTTLTTTDHRRDKGQTAVEYLGIIAVVVAIVLAITGTDIGQTIYNAIRDKITEVTGG
jgi:pilus assembly protein Flp/PilA